MTGYATFAEEAISVGSSATKLTANNLYASPPPSRVEIQVRGAQIRYRLDGTDPTSGVGKLANPFDYITLTQRNDMTNFSAIQVSAAATLWVSWERER